MSRGAKDPFAELLQAATRAHAMIRDLTYQGVQRYGPEWVEMLNRLTDAISGVTVKELKKRKKRDEP